MKHEEQTSHSKKKNELEIKSIVKCLMLVGPMYLEERLLWKKLCRIELKTKHEKKPTDYQYKWPKMRL